MPKQPDGCLKRFLVTLLSVSLIVAVIGFAVYQRIGGSPGVKRRLANMALSGTQKRMLEYRPDGISEQEIRDTISAVRKANDHPEAVDLLALYRILDEYNRRFRGSKPSTNEMLSYLQQLRETILESGE